MTLSQIPSCCLVTGGSGFIGTNFIRLIIKEWPETHIINVDKLTYAGNPANLRDLETNHYYHFVRQDITNKDAMTSLCNGSHFSQIPKPEIIIHFAAESHVDRSIVDPYIFLQTNIIGTATLLDQVKQKHVKRMIHISTDEVYGDLEPEAPAFYENQALNPSSPYSTSKASSDLLVKAYIRTFGIDAIITRCSNNYGPYQFPEKLIPLMILNASQNKPLPVYGNGLNIRDWVHVEDHCRGILASIMNGKSGGVYHFGGNCEVRNIDVVKNILSIMRKDHSLITYITDRPGHDKRYAMNIENTSKLLNWKPLNSFEQGLTQTIEWYLSHQDWWQPILTGEYQKWIQTWYGE